MPMSLHAASEPDKVASIMAGSGESLTYGQLNERSIQLARLLADGGLVAGDVVAIFMENNLRYHEVYWAAVRSGMYLGAINKYLTADEAAYIVNDSEAKAIVTSAAMADAASAMADAIDACSVRLALDGAVEGYDRYEAAIETYSTEPLDYEPLGDFMNYSSGTTGRPKGIKRPLAERSFTEPSNLDQLISQLYGVDTDATYLSPAPLYHSAPLAFTAAVHSLGGTNVILERFDPMAALAAIETHQVTHSQWVPTMFIRMLKLDDADRLRHDISSQKVVIHAAAPCPVEVKRQMIDWWGPIIWEYYAGTELNGMTVCNSQQWLAHPGTVGSPMLGVLHICDEDGNELPTGEAGVIYFERDEMPFAYHNDSAKTDGARHPQNALWTKLGDIGYVDDDGYLYLTDRESFMIISGGVNIYPQEIEDAIVMHPMVAPDVTEPPSDEEFRQHPVAHWTEQFLGTSTAAVPLGSLHRTRTESLALESEGLPALHGATFQTVRHDHHPMGRWCDLVAPCAVRPQRASIRVPGPAPKCGADTRTVLAELGHDSTTVDALIASGAVGESWAQKYLPD